MSTKTLLKQYVGKRGQLAEAASGLASALQSGMFDALGRGESPTGGRVGALKATFSKVVDSIDAGESALDAAGVIEGDLRALTAQLRDAVDQAEREAKALHGAHMRRSLPINPRPQAQPDYEFLRNLARTLGRTR